MTEIDSSFHRYHLDTFNPEALERVVSQGVEAHTSFYNPKWTNEQVRAAATYAYNQALANGVTDGTYSVQYLGEKVTAAFENGVLQTVYGPHYFTLEEFFKLLGVD